METWETNEEDLLDIASYEEGMCRYKENPVTYTLEEVEEELGI